MRVFALIITIIVAFVVGAWIIAGITGDGALDGAGNDVWPAGLGTLASVEQRVHPQKTNAAAQKLIELGAPLEISFATPAMSSETPMRQAIGDYVNSEHERAEASIGAPPAEVTAYLAQHEREIDALRDHLLQAETIQWDIDPSKGFQAPVPNLLAHMLTARLLTARALERGRANDLRAWEDLHAVARLARSLEPRPDLISQMILLAMSRMVNAAAWKLPPADAPWLEELQRVDHRRLLLAADQYDSWTMWRHGRSAPLAQIAKPFHAWTMVNTLQHQRETAEKIAATTACAFDGEAFSKERQAALPRWNVVGNLAIPNIGAAWQRMFRSIAEREAAANAMRITRGEPIVAKSVCSDGTWSYDGATLRFSRELPRSNEHENVMPLALKPARAIPRST